MMILRWFWSRTVRHAYDLRKHVWVVLNAQRDVLSDNAVEELNRELDDFDRTLRGNPREKKLKAAIHTLEETGAKWLQPYPNAGTRENIKEFLVSAVLILAIFSFFIQPMKIPSGSAQPTLYGNVITDYRAAEDYERPGRSRRFIDWFRGFDHHLWVAKDSGPVRIGPTETVFMFVRRQTFHIGNDSYSFYWPPDGLANRLNLRTGQVFSKGDVVINARVQSGDRLFVDRFSYNFRRPGRGETIVFRSSGIRDLIQNTHYIKRLIGKGGDRIQIGNDRHVIVNGERLDATTPYFEKVYSFNGPPRDSVYSGHVNATVGRQYSTRNLAPQFQDANAAVKVRKNHYLAFGDNTMNSHDGRTWRDFPRDKVVGKAFFVFWPFTERFGLIYR